MVIGHPRKALRSHLAQHVETDGAVPIATSHLVDDEAPIFRRDGVSGFHGPDMALFDGKQFREWCDPDSVDDVFEGHTRSLRQVAMPVKTACSDFHDTLRSMTREEIIKRREQGARLRKARESAGYRSARSAALDNHWAESTYRAHEGGTRTIGQDDAEAYAKRLRHKGAAVTAALILFGEESANASSVAVAPPVPSPENAAAATLDIASKGIPRTRAQLEILVSRIVREAVEVTARKVYSTVAEKLPTDDVLRV